jgi:hypothetical protein
MMSIVRFTGGLGNQLFQICFGKTLSISTGTPTIYDATEYKFRSNKAARKLELPKSHDLLIKNRTNALISKLPNRVLLVTERRMLDMEKRSLYPEYKLVLEGVDIYDANLEYQPNCYYVGNFISHKYWKENTSLILSWVSTQIYAKTDQLTKHSSNSIGIHVRRGDYLENSKVRNLHGYCTDNYYLKSIKRILELDPSVTEVVFSSDSFEKTAILRENIISLGLTVQELKKLNPLETLKRLSFSEYFIGSNSTFSWWAAALNPKKMSIFPTDWFISGSYGFEFNEYFPFPVLGMENALSSDLLA